MRLKAPQKCRTFSLLANEFDWPSDRNHNFRIYARCLFLFVWFLNFDVLEIPFVHIHKWSTFVYQRRNLREQFNWFLFIDDHLMEIEWNSFGIDHGQWNSMNLMSANSVSRRKRIFSGWLKWIHGKTHCDKGTGTETTV